MLHYVNALAHYNEVNCMIAICSCSGISGVVVTHGLILIVSSSTETIGYTDLVFSEFRNLYSLALNNLLVFISRLGHKHSMHDHLIQSIRG